MNSNTEITTESGLEVHEIDCNLRSHVDFMSRYNIYTCGSLKSSCDYIGYKHRNSYYIYVRTSAKPPFFFLIRLYLQVLSLENKQGVNKSRLTYCCRPDPLILSANRLFVWIFWGFMALTFFILGANVILGLYNHDYLRFLTSITCSVLPIIIIRILMYAQKKSKRLADIDTNMLISLINNGVSVKDGQDKKDLGEHQENEE